VDIPEANIDRETHYSMGTIRSYQVRIKGDGAGRQINVPFSRVEGYWITNITETTDLKATESAGAITYAYPPGLNLYHYLFVIGY
jgi:hypothetical protein